MPDFRPLLDHVPLRVRAKVERDIKRIRRVTQLYPDQLAPRALVGAGDTIILQRRGSVAIRVNDLQGRFQDVAIPPLRIRLIPAGDLTDFVLANDLLK